MNKILIKKITYLMIFRLIDKMNGLPLVMIVYFYIFFQCDCRSVHVHEEIRPQFEVNDEKPLNHKHENKDTVSWIKLKPILRQEMQHVRNAKGVESMKIFTEGAHESHSVNEEIPKSNSSITESNIDFVKTVTQNRTDTFEIDNAAKNVTLIPDIETVLPEDYSSNVTDTEPLEIDEAFHIKEFPYNITPDILAESGDLIVFLAVNDNENKIVNASNSTSLLSEAVSIALDGISTTGYELLRDFESQQNLIVTKLPDVENNRNESLNFQMDNNSDVLKLPDNLESENENYSERTTEDIEQTTEVSEDIEMSVPERIENVPEKSQKDEKFHTNLTENRTEFENKEDVSDFDSTLIQSNISDSEENITSKNESHTYQIVLNKYRTESENINNHITPSLENTNLTNFSKANKRNSKCPDPGVCIFWFLAFDSCDEDSHCFESHICCMWGCSKMCMDVNSELL